MKTNEHGIEGSKDVENVYHMRLMTLLQELVREKGYKGAARVLEIDHRTVAVCSKTGQMSRRARQALERALQEGVGSAAVRQRERNDGLEERVGRLEKGSESFGKEVRKRLCGRRGWDRGSAPGQDPGDRGRSRRRRSLPAWCRRVGSPCVSPAQKAPVEAQGAAGVPRPRDP